MMLCYTFEDTITYLTIPAFIITMASMYSLHDDLLCLIFAHIPAQDLLQRTNRTCRRFARILRDSSFWEKRARSTKKQGPHFSMSGIPMTVMQYQRIAMLGESLVVSSHKTLGGCNPNNNNTTQTASSEAPTPQIPNCLEYGSLLTMRDRARQLRVGGQWTCAASSTDHARECLEQVLPEQTDATSNDEGPDSTGTRWWSSQPTPLPNTSEALAMATRAPLTVISRLKIKPLRDPFPSTHIVQVAAMEFHLLGEEAPRPVYSWRSTKIRAYHLKSRHAHGAQQQDSFQEGFPCVWRITDHMQAVWSRQQRHFDPQLIPKDAVLVYESEAIPVHDSMSDEMMEFTLPNVIANVVTIELEGKNHEQWPGSGFYCCVEKLDIEGIPLLAHDTEIQHNRTALARQGLAPITHVGSNGALVIY